MTQIDEKKCNCVEGHCGESSYMCKACKERLGIGTAPPHHITVTIDTRTHKVVPLIPDEKMLLAGFSYADMIAAAPEHKEG